MNQLVLDASVAFKWTLPAAIEPLSSEAVRLLQRYANGDVDFIVPDIFWAEIGNIAWKGARQRRWSQKEAHEIAGSMQARQFKTVSSLSLLADALKLACAFDRTIYDCLYVALAVQSKTELITADERLATSLAAYLPVKWLGAL